MHGNGGRHRRADPYLGRHRQDEILRVGRRATALALVSIGIGSMALAASTAPARHAPTTTTLGTDALDARQLAQEASRSLTRTPAPVAKPTTKPTTAPKPKATATRKPTPKATATKKATPKATATKTATPKATAKRVTLPVPVGGLSQAQMNHAATIVKVGQQLAMPRRAYIVAIATVLQESYLRNMANGYYPESLNLAHDGVGADHDSVGLFQQRPSAGWGTVAQCMTPAYAAGKFYEGLSNVYAWQSLSVAEAAQAVQVSAFPDAYAKHEPLATLIVDALT